MFVQARKAVRKINQLIRDNQFKKRLRRVNLILNDEASDVPFFEPEALFLDLQQRFPVHGEYGYDAYATWNRGYERIQKLLLKTGILSPEIQFLEAACGDGMVGKAAAAFGFDVTLCDLEDWRDPRVRDLPFIQADLSRGIPAADERFDLIVSYNAFEHIQNPERAFNELCRVCKPGGLIYLEFGPLYCSPWGLHAYRTFHMPYPQFLFSESFVNAKLRQFGFSDLGKEMDNLQPLNRWSISQFEQLFHSPCCEIVQLEKYELYDHLDIILQFPWAFQNQDLTLADVTTQSIRVLLRKKLR